MKKALSLIATVFIKLFGIAILFGIIGYGFHISILGMFGIGFAVNLILGLIVNYIYTYKHEKLVVEMNKKALEYEENNSVSVPCAYCHKANVVPLRLRQTIFVCPTCKNQNRLLVDFRAARITTPVNTKDMASRM